MPCHEDAGAAAVEVSRDIHGPKAAPLWILCRENSNGDEANSASPDRAGMSDHGVTTDIEIAHGLFRF
jgi:hypothetical protein